MDSDLSVVYLISAVGSGHLSGRANASVTGPEGRKRSAPLGTVDLPCCVPGEPGCLSVRSASVPNLKGMSTLTLVMVDENLVQIKELVRPRLDNG